MKVTVLVKVVACGMAAQKELSYNVAEIPHRTGLMSIWTPAQYLRLIVLERRTFPDKREHVVLSGSIHDVTLLRELGWTECLHERT